MNLKKKAAAFFTKPKVRFVINRFLLMPFFVFPIILLYLREPQSFEFVWTGRTVYVIFLWLFLMEIVLAWSKPLKNSLESFNARVVVSFVSVLIPTVYVYLMSRSDFRSRVIELGRFLGVGHFLTEPFKQNSSTFLEVAWPLALEFFIFAFSFWVSVWLLYGLTGFRRFSISGFFVGVFSIFYALDVFFPYGTLQAIEYFVPITVTASTWVLNILGYQTFTAPVMGGSLLRVAGNHGSAAFLVYWPSAGIQSLILYSFTILLFLRDAAMPHWRKGVYFAIGAVGTFFANVFRIVSISMLGVNVGDDAARMFHDYYGELFFVTWMIAYLLMVLVIESYVKRRSKKHLLDSTPMSFF